MSAATSEKIAVVGPKGEKATVIAVQNHPSRSPNDGVEMELVYGMGGLTVEKISDHAFRDFQGVVRTIDIAAGETSAINSAVMGGKPSK